MSRLIVGKEILPHFIRIFGIIDLDKCEAFVTPSNQFDVEGWDTLSKGGEVLPNASLPLQIVAQMKDLPVTYVLSFFHELRKLGLNRQHDDRKTW